MEGRYFTTTKKGEIAEWKSELRNMDKDKRKDAVKKVIAAMTVGKDVASLFPDVINCMQTDDLELKKLVYLYLINYAKSQPDLAIMAVNTFVKDSQDNNPLIRALAVRTMGCIRVDRITEYLCDPLQKCLRDQDPYVRKTAAICVVKLHDISPQLVEDHGFLDQLRDLLSDPNPMVVANAVAALAEIQDHSNLRVLNVTKMMLSKLLAALGECTEWGQVFILDALAHYEARDRREAEMIIERVIPRLQHVNCAVVLSAVKVVIKNLEILGGSEGPLPIYRKLAPPLVSLLSSEPEVQYVVLRNISLIIQKYPSILQHEIKAFFCKYNDPVYVKLEKIDILIKLVSMKNIDQVLLELKEYATEVDMVFVKRAIRAIGQCAVCVVDAVERCIKVLVELVQTKVNFLVQQAVIIIVDIFRQFPNRFEGVIPILCENLETLDDPEAKAALIWVLGEYADRISNAVELLESFLETFPEEEPQVQLQLLTSAVKLFLKNPTERPQQMIQLVLSNATGENDNPDLRDRAYIYWRLLSSDPEGTKEVLLGEKPAIDRSIGDIDAGKLKSLLANISTLSSVYHCLPEEFVTAEKRTGCGRVHHMDAIPSALAPNGTAGHAQALEEESYGVAGHEGLKSGKQKSQIDELLGLDVGMIPASQSRDAPGLPPSDVLTGTSFELPQPSQAVSHIDLSLSPILLLAEKGKGLEIRGFTGLQDGTPVLHLHFRNATSSTLSGFRIQVNKNVFGLSPITQQIKLPTVEVNQSATTTVLLKLDSSSAVESQGSPFLQVAVKNETLGVMYFAVRLGLSCILASKQRITPAQFVEHWQSLSAEKEKARALPKGRIKDIEAFLAECEGCSLHCLARRPVEGSGRVVLFLGGTVLPYSEPLLVELSYSKEKYGVKYCVKCAQTCIAQLGMEMFSHILEKHTLVQG